MIILRIFIILICIGFPFSISSKEHYTQDKGWGNKIDLDNNIVVKSRIRLNEHQVTIILNTYIRFKDRFFYAFRINDNDCLEDRLNIIIVNDHKELSDRQYFLDEQEYADEDNIIYGRYYAITRRLYIVPINRYKYYWESNFQHELMHYFIDRCAILVRDEHETIKRFLDNGEVYVR